MKDILPVFNIKEKNSYTNSEIFKESELEKGGMNLGFKTRSMRRLL